MSGLEIKSILRRVSRYEGGTEEMDVVPPKDCHPRDDWEPKLKFNLTPEQAERSDNRGPYRQYYAERKKMRKESRRMRKFEEEDEGPIDWAAMGITAYTPEEWARIQMEKNGGKPLEEKKKEEPRIYTGITITEYYPAAVTKFMNKWLKLLKLPIKIEGDDVDSGNE